jgi:DNA invertase Pin-like site-specific DNA recombinase
VTAIRAAVAGIADELAPPLRAAIYCRLSEVGGRSVERQERDGRRIAKERRWVVTGPEPQCGVYKETASASAHAKKARKEWDALLAAVEAGHFDAVILWMEDRSARDVLAAGAFVQACRKAGLTRLVLPSLDYDLSDPEDVAKFYGEVAAAQREAAKTSKRTRRARLEEAEDGWPHPGGHRGFGEPGGRRVRNETKADDDPEKWLTDEHGRWLRVGAVPPAQVNRERELIREAARRVVAGDSLRGIVGDWNRQEIPSPTGGRWTTRVLRQMLLSPRLVGYRQRRGQVVTDDDGRPVRLVDGPSVRDGRPVEPALVEPILDVETWEAVRGILSDPARMTTAVGRAPSYLLTGLAFCARHGTRMEGIRNGGRAAYRCPGSGKGGGTCLQRLAAPIEDLILRALFQAVENPTWHEAAAERSNGDPTRPHYERLAELTAELDVLDRRIGEAELAEELGRRPHPSAATLRRMLADREAEREQHQAAVTRLQHGRVVAAVPRNLRAVWPKLSLDRQRAILAAMIERVEIHPQGRGRVFDPDAIKVFRRDRSDLTP